MVTETGTRRPCCGIGVGVVQPAYNPNPRANYYFPATLSRSLVLYIMIICPGGEMADALA